MSVNADCRFVEFAPGRWKYAYQKWPYGETEEYDVRGPFSSFVKAREDMDSRYPNPGGWMLDIHPTGHIHEPVDDGDGVGRTVCDSCGYAL